MRRFFTHSMRCFPHFLDNWHWFFSKQSSNIRAQFWAKWTISLCLRFFLAIFTPKDTKAVTVGGVTPTVDCNVFEARWLSWVLVSVHSLLPGDGRVPENAVDAFAFADPTSENDCAARSPLQLSTDACILTGKLKSLMELKNRPGEFRKFRSFFSHALTSSTLSC
jgi:hypothetical protein